MKKIAVVEVHHNENEEDFNTKMKISIGMKNLMRVPTFFVFMKPRQIEPIAG